MTIFLLIITIVTVAFVILAMDLTIEKIITSIKEHQEQKRLEEVKRYAAFFSDSGSIQR